MDIFHFSLLICFCHWLRMTTSKYKLLCPRGHKPARWPWPTSRLTEMEKWSWIRIRNPISTKIELILEVHPCSHPPNLVVIHEPVLEISCGQKECAQTDRQTERQTDTRRWPQDLAAYGAQVINEYDDDDTGRRPVYSTPISEMSITSYVGQR